MVFDNIENVWDDNPAGTPGNETSAHLVASDPAKRIGTAIMLRTMPGDEFRISADCFYQGAYSPGSTVSAADMVSSLTNALLGGETYTGVPVSEMQQNVAIISQAMNNPALPSQLNSMLSANTDPSAPQAYLNYLMFDQNLQLIPAKSGAVQVPTGSGSGIPWTTITPSILDGEVLRADAPGYIVIYINNNSIGKDVYFDDIKIEHYNGNVLEESHYYPFGLTVSQAASGATAPVNPYKYNTKELETSFGLEQYDYGARMYNPQIGRWNGIDRLAEQNSDFSPFAYVLNNPISKIDPDGNTDYDVVLRTSVNSKTGIVTRTANVNVVYNVLNISSKDVYNETQLAGSGYKDATYSTTLNFDKGEVGNKSPMAINVNVNISYRLTNDINKVNNNENVMLIVDDVIKMQGDKVEPAGRAEMAGQVAAIEHSSMSKNTLVKHEMGHNFGLEHTEGANLLNPTPTTTNMTEKQRKQIFSAFTGLKDGTHHMGGKNARQETQKFFDKTKLSYDRNKAKKAGL